MSFVQRLINYKFQLNNQGDILDISGCRSSAIILQKGANAVNLCGYSADVRIWGLTLDHMNQLSAINRAPLIENNNLVEISAGDIVNGMYVVFNGWLRESWAQMNGAPDCYLQFNAISAPFVTNTPIVPTSAPGPVDVAKIMESLAKLAGYSFVNKGVTIQLGSIYLSGDLSEQIRALKEQADIELSIENGVLTIWSKDTVREDQNQLISPETGMVGYPVHSGNGMIVTTIFNPNFVPGNKVTVKSLLKPACGDFLIKPPITHQLESMLPGGHWFTQLFLMPIVQ